MHALCSICICTVWVLGTLYWFHAFLQSYWFCSNLEAMKLMISSLSVLFSNNNNYDYHLVFMETWSWRSSTVRTGNIDTMCLHDQFTINILTKIVLGVLAPRSFADGSRADGNMLPVLSGPVWEDQLHLRCQEIFQCITFLCFAIFCPLPVIKKI